MVLSTLADGSEKMCYLNLKHAAVVFVALLSMVAVWKVAGCGGYCFPPHVCRRIK